ncbi:MAG: ion transporter, partial [Pyramidobacter sp.]|nr:ion transporter [Pyramidobacter sp.]
MRKRIYEIIEIARPGDRVSNLYDTAMLCLILLSLIPLAFKDSYPLFDVIEGITVAVFIADYALRWLTADCKLRGPKALAFIRYPFTLWALVDLVSILPSLNILASGFKLLRSLRMIRALRVLRVAKAMRYSHSLIIIASVIDRSRRALGAVMILAVGYILISALIVFNVEP